MINLKTTNSDLILIKLPKDATWWKIEKLVDTPDGFIAKTLSLSENTFRFGTSDGLFYSPDNFYLPDGNWEIIGKFNELKDENFEPLVDFKKYEQLDKNGSPLIMWKDYEYIFDNECELFDYDTAKQSFKSLCRYYNLEDDLSDYLIIKKE